MNKFNKIFIYTSVIFTSIPFWILTLTKIKIIAFPIILTLLLVIGIFHLIDKIHPTLLFGRFNLSKFNKNLFIFSLTMNILIFTVAGIKNLIEDKEFINKLSNIKDLAVNVTTVIIAISFTVWGITLVLKRIVDKKYYRNCVIKSDIQLESFITGDKLIFDIELNTPILNEKEFKFITHQLELKEILKKNQKIKITGVLGILHKIQDDGTEKDFNIIDGEIINKDFILNHKIKLMKDTFKNLKSKEENK